MSTPRPLFVYGTLCAMPLLAWALTGDATQTSIVRPLAQNATVKGYARFTVRGKDYPAVIKHNQDSIVDGFLLRLQTKSQRRKLDDFEGEAYTVTPVSVMVKSESGDTVEIVDADMYVWAGETDAVSSEAWVLQDFIRDRLDDWIELFGGMELVGDDDT
ncbi:hypothetical protein VKT23_002818 [Stygiomarasmius scandens]|uniref:Putative gamma-glutamylcyclotransferase n=1 Tax=Marasmiellus scandens TaxID=2682957 RepID=A0ABR1K124_9AGAR